MSDQLFLVTGATGETGRRTVACLTEMGKRVRALVHTEDERAERLRSSGAEVVVGNLLDLDSVRAALGEVNGAYFVYPLEIGLIDATALFVQAAKEASVGAIVNMSQISARREARSHAARNHWIAEQLFDWSGVPTTHLRPTFFAQWLTYPNVRRSIAERSVIALPFGAGRHAPIAAEDQARLIASILVDPAPHRSETYPLHGPIEMDHYEIAEAVGEVLGRKISYIPVEIEDFRLRLEQIPAFSPYFIQHLCAVVRDYQNGIFAGTNDLIERITEQRPMTVQAFVKAHLESMQP